MILEIVNVNLPECSYQRSKLREVLYSNNRKKVDKIGQTHLHKQTHEYIIRNVTASIAIFNVATMTVLAATYIASFIFPISRLSLGNLIKSLVHKIIAFDIT